MLTYTFFQSFCDCKPGSILAYFRFCGPASFWHFPWPQTYEFLAFSVTARLRVFGIFRYLGPASFLWFLHKYCPMYYFGDREPGSFLACFRDRRPASFWHFPGPQTCEFLAFSLTADLRVFGIFCHRRGANFWHLSSQRTCEFLEFLHKCWPMLFLFFVTANLEVFRHIFVTADQRVFDIFSWPRTCEFLPVSVIVDLWVFVIFP